MEFIFKQHESFLTLEGKCFYEEGLMYEGVSLHSSYNGYRFTDHKVLKNLYVKKIEDDKVLLEGDYASLKETDDFLEILSKKNSFCELAQSVF